MKEGSWREVEKTAAIAMGISNQEKDHFFTIGIFQLCNDLHMLLTGALGSDILSDEHAERVAAYLRYRLQIWEVRSSGVQASEAYDAAARSLVVAVLAEYSQQRNDPS